VPAFPQRRRAMRVLPLLLSSILTASLLAQRYQDVTF
jgi:hypothetical protein